MSKNTRNPKVPPSTKEKGSLKLVRPVLPATKSFLDIMEDGREYESMQRYRPEIDAIPEIKRSIKEISDIRGRTVVCYLANVVNTTLRVSPGIDNGDDLPFSEMIDSIPSSVKEIDIILVTPGGSSNQVAKFVDKIRPRFDHVTFILPNMAMSAGTIFVTSGDEIIMDSRSYIGPIDPQVRNREGQFVPAQSILTLVDEIQKRNERAVKNGESPLWSDLQILRHLDLKDLGVAMNASEYSIELVENYLNSYKFKNWVIHSTTGNPVTADEKKQRAKEIAKHLCNHGEWKTHSRGIPREVAWEVCKLRIEHAENTPGLERSIRRFWALIYWFFENFKVVKFFISDNYGIIRSEKQQIEKK